MHRSDCNYSCMLTIRHSSVRLNNFNGLLVMSILPDELPCSTDIFPWIWQTKRPVCDVLFVCFSQRICFSANFFTFWVCRKINEICFQVTISPDTSDGKRVYPSSKSNGWQWFSHLTGLIGFRDGSAIILPLLQCKMSQSVINTFHTLPNKTWPSLDSSASDCELESGLEEGRWKIRGGRMQLEGS